MYREIRLIEAIDTYGSNWLPITTLEAGLNAQELALVNTNKWQEAYDSAKSDKERQYIVQLFINKRYGAYKNNLSPGKDIIVSIIEQLGFKETENPYLKFIELFFGSNPNVQISRDGWIALNDFLANDIINESALFGNGHDGQKHLVFNPNVYTSSLSVKDMLTLMKDYEYLSDAKSLANMNLQSIYEYGNGNPYGQLKQFTDNTSGKILSNDNATCKKVRNIIVYRNPEDELGELNSLYWINNAIQLGTNLASKEAKTMSDQDVRDLLDKLRNLPQDQVSSIYQELEKHGITLKR